MSSLCGLTGFVKQLLTTILLFSSLAYINEALAQSSPYPNVWRRAQLLPAGQSLFTLSSNFSRFSDQLSEDGSSVSVGSAYTQSVTWNELLADQGGAGGSNQGLREYVKGQGLNLDSVAASSKLAVSQEVLNLSPQWAYGMTSSWMVGFRLPVVYHRTQVSSVIEVSEDYAKLARGAELDSINMGTRARQAISRKLQQYNYEPIQSDSKEWRIGDAELLSKFKILQTPDLLFSLRQRVTVPTGSGKDPYRYIQTSGEDNGQLDLGVDAVADYWFARRWVMTTSLGYTWQTADQIRARARQENKGISQDVDLEVNRNLGDYWTANLFAEHSLALQWRVLGGYSYLNKTGDTYEGGARYEALAQGSQKEVHIAHAGLSYRAEPFSQRQGLKTQFATSLYFSTVVSGSNVPDTSLAGLDLQLLF